MQMKCADCMEEVLATGNLAADKCSIRPDVVNVAHSMPDAISAGSHGRPVCLWHFIENTLEQTMRPGNP